MAAAKVVANLQILGLCLLHLCLAASAAAYYPDMLLETSFIPRDYARYADVARRCRSALASADELSPFDPVGAGVLARDLSFANGDWGQDAGRAPLMPSQGGDSPFLRLATFAVTHIDTDALRRRRPAMSAVNVSGVLSFTITRNCCCSSEYAVPHRQVSPEFKFLPGASRLTILFEGVYTETRSPGNDDDIGGGERVLCMVGNGVLPMRGGDSADPWAWARNAGDGSFEPPVMADGNMVLMLRYPKVHTLTTRAVRGELTSTSAASHNAYFDAVRLVSRIGQYSSYLFRPEHGELAANGCSTSTTRPFVCDDGVEGNCAGDLHGGASFCDILTELSPGDHGVLAVVPNWNCNSTDEFCSRLGPFQTGGGATNTTDRMLTGFAIAMQDLRCEPHGGEKPAARVSAVFRAVSPWEDQQLAVRRTGLGGATLSAEGVWRASTGQLCMTGCLGVIDAAAVGDEACHYRVSLHVPTTFSIRRRSIIVGQITAGDGSHFPLSFHQSVPPKHPWNRFGRSEASLRVAYDYTKVENAGELLRRSEPSGFRSSSIAKALVSYPRQAGAAAAAADEMMSLSDLADDLSLHFQPGPRLPFLPEQKVWPQWPVLHLDMLSVGPLVGSYSPPLRTLPSTPVARAEIDGGVEQQQHQLLNVSAVLSLSGKMFGWSPVMSLEGVYNQEDGRMYLIGCRNVEAPWRIVSTSRDLEDGMDCSIEVRVEYPPKTTRWLFSPTATACISSTRDAGDPLHFNTTELRTTPISYRGGRRDAPPDTLTEQTIEGLVCIAMLSGTIAAAVGQLRYIASHPDVAPYVSLVALGVQAVGYTATLVTDAKMLPAWPTYNYRMYVGHLHWNMDSTVKALTLAALLLTLRLAQKVRRSRARARARYHPIPRKYHVIHGRNYLIPREYHVIRGKNRLIHNRHRMIPRDNKISGAVDMGTNLLFLPEFLLYTCMMASSCFAYQFNPSEEAEHSYLRFADVERQCRSVLTSASELADNAYRVKRVKRELSFEKGDWRQDAGTDPLVPFDGGDAAEDGRRPPLDPLRLATFVVTHVDDDDERRARNAVNVSGLLVLTISRTSASPEIGYHVPVVSSPVFELLPGSTKLRIVFEGVYTEAARSGNGGGERVLCMVGAGVLPTRGADGADPWGWAKNSGRAGFQPPVATDESMLLVLRYPKELTLTTRAVVGEMRSTRAMSDAAYFDTVKLVSGSTWNRQYEFRRPEELAAAAGTCRPLTSSDDGGNRARDLYKGRHLCDVLERYIHGVITARPTWRHCNSTATGAPCPFEMDRAEDAAIVGIVLHDLRCLGYDLDMAGNPGGVKVSVVFRALSPREHWYTAVQRTALSGATLSAEGVWNASAGEVSMVACRGIGGKACHFRVCLSFPATFSITGRDMMLGEITTVDVNETGGGARSSLSFRQRMPPPRLQRCVSGILPVVYRYNYTKVKLAGEFLRRNSSPSDLREIIARSLPLSYPNCGGNGDGKRSLADLADRLTLRFTAMPSLFSPPGWMERPVLHLEVFFLGQLIERFMPASDDATTRSSAIPGDEPCLQEQRLLNVSAELTIFGDLRVASSAMSLEGVYDREDGRMYLIGCRDVHHLPWRSSSARRELELKEGMDCSIEVKVEYPPPTTHWFVRSTARVQIASTRVAGDDPLHFDTVKLRAQPVRYPRRWPDFVSRAIVDSVLCVVLLMATIPAALCQLHHLKHHADVAPYVSLVMLGVQALGLVMPLFAGMEALLARVTLQPELDTTRPRPPPGSSYMLDYNPPYQAVDRTAKILAVAAFLLTLCIAWKVRRSRARLLARSSGEAARVPSDGKVFVYCSSAHLALFVVVLALNSSRDATVEQHVGLMQDMFLLPQVIGNAAWRVNCKPLAGSFYVGITAARLLPRAYDLVRPTPVADVFSDDVHASETASAISREGFFPRAGDVVMPLAAVSLAGAVFVQQRWNYAIVSRMGNSSQQQKLHHIF
uniref:RING-type E3 ubiquitin transferase n=1 Tax=Oryza barthii TaxID=65489 RepID=A0A0D3GST2_9ORYZ